METFQFTSAADGLTIHGYRWPLTGPVRANVVISHGLAEHAARYERFAAALNGAGYAVHAPDHRAHGRTLGPNGFGDFGSGGWDALVADLDQLIDDIRAEQPETPVILFGHSMGAAAAQQFVQQGSHKIAALVLSGTTARRPGEPVPDYNAAFAPARTAYDWLSRDPAEVDAYVADPLCGFEGQTLIKGFDRHDTRRIDPERIAGIRTDLPVLLVAGDADPVNAHLAGLQFLETLWRGAGVECIDTRYYPGGRHEMLNETNREEVTRDILAWLERYGTRAHSGCPIPTSR